jgi:hypothetical protein
LGDRRFLPYRIEIDVTSGLSLIFGGAKNRE